MKGLACYTFLLHKSCQFMPVEGTFRTLSQLAGISKAFHPFIYRAKEHCRKFYIVARLFLNSVQKKKQVKEIEGRSFLSEFFNFLSFFQNAAAHFFLDMSQEKKEDKQQFNATKLFGAGSSAF